MAEDVSGFIHAGVQGTIRQNEELALMCQVLKCLATYIKELKLPVTLNTVKDNIGMVEYAVNQAFPGYVESKLLKYIIQPVKVI